MSFFLIKRYEICLNPALTLHPNYFNAANWAKGKYTAELITVLQEMSTHIVAASRVGNVTYQCFAFSTNAERVAWLGSLDIPHRTLGRVGRQLQSANRTVNLFFDFQETVEDGYGAPNINDIKRSLFRADMAAASLGQNRDLLVQALSLQFPS